MSDYAQDDLPVIVKDLNHVTKFSDEWFRLKEQEIMLHNQFTALPDVEESHVGPEILHESNAPMDYTSFDQSIAKKMKLAIENKL